MVFLRKLLKKIFINDFSSKLLSILLASCLWFYVTVLSLEKTYINLPIELINTPDDLSIKYNDKLNVKVEIEAREDVSLYLSRLRAVIDLTNSGIGKRQFPIILQNLPTDINVDLNPKYISLDIQKIVSNNVPITIEFTNKSANIHVTNIRISPNTVSIEGNTSEINKIKSIKTEVFDLKNMRDSNHIITNLKLNIPSKVNIKPSGPVSVEIFIENYNITNKVFLPFTIINLKPELVIPAIPTFEFTTLSADSNIEGLLLQTEISVDFSKITNEGEHSVPITILAPNNLKFLNAPEQIVIVVEKDPEISTLLTNNTSSMNSTITNNKVEKVDILDKDPFYTNETILDSRSVN